MIRRGWGASDWDAIVADTVAIAIDWLVYSRRGDVRPGARGQLRLPLQPRWQRPPRDLPSLGLSSSTVNGPDPYAMTS
jgi:hypothetical protein